jgi:hypothetical protein
MPPSSIARVTTGRSSSKGEPRASAIRRACSTWRASLPIPGESSTSWTSSPQGKLDPTRRGGPAESRLVPDAGNAGELLDRRAKEAYRRRLTEIDEDIEEARTMGDVERAAQGDAERECLLRELARAVGLGGRDRRAGSASERARSAVTRAIRQALARLREHNPSLGEHLDRTIRTGTCCAYMPD